MGEYLGRTNACRSQFRRIENRRGVSLNSEQQAKMLYNYISVDKLYVRAMWRRQGNALRARCSVVSGNRYWFLAP